MYTLEYYTHKYILSRGVNKSLQEAAALPVELVVVPMPYASPWGSLLPSSFRGFFENEKRRSRSPFESFSGMTFSVFWLPF